MKSYAAESIATNATICVGSDPMRCAAVCLVRNKIAKDQKQDKANWSSLSFHPAVSMSIWYGAWFR
jgi:hypothetical protein